MLRRLSIIAIIAASSATLFAQRAERAQSETLKFTQPGRANSALTSASHTRKVPAAAATAAGNLNRGVLATATEDASTPAQAPGVTQMNLWDTGREAYFVATETLPVGTTIQATIEFPTSSTEDRRFFTLDTLNVVEDLPPGFSLVLPGIKTLGDFWRKGLTVYNVWVTKPGGSATISSYDFATRSYYRNASDVSYFTPRIDSVREFTDSGSTLVELKGSFLTSGTTYIVFEDIVAPAESVTIVDQSTIRVNLNKVPGIDTTLMKGSLLTIGQGGWSDTFPFRHSLLQ